MGGSSGGSKSFARGAAHPVSLQTVSLAQRATVWLCEMGCASRSLDPDTQTRECVRMECVLREKDGRSSGQEKTPIYTNTIFGQ